MLRNQMPPHEKSEDTRWFLNEVYAHEPSLKSYLRGAYPAVRDVDDVVQSAYLRIWKTRMERPIAFAKTFLFQVARHLVVDRVRRAQHARTDSWADLSELPVFDEAPGAVEVLTYAEKVELLGHALGRLPVRCREVMILRKFHQVSVRDIALRLGVAERTVESQITRGTQLLAKDLRAQGVESFCRHET
ncbi:MAG: RNA polymerase sigma factor [Verrucomicrobiota bacterium]